MIKNFFGTDGIRGRVGDEPITAEFMLKLGWASGKVFSKEGRGLILIGKDTRVSGYMFESALEAGLASAGVDVKQLKIHMLATKVLTMLIFPVNMWCWYWYWYWYWCWYWC